MTTTTTEAATKDNHDSNGKDKSMEPLFRVVDGLVSDSDGDGDDGGVNDADALLSVVILPGCLNVLPENPGTAVLLVDSPALHRSGTQGGDMRARARTLLVGRSR